MRRIAGLALLALAACSPGAPPGTDKARLDDAVSRAIGDPATCVLIGESKTGRVLYRYNTAVVCGRVLRSCVGKGQASVGDVLKAVAKDGRERTLTCDSAPDPSRTVGWAAGPVQGRSLVYAAAMEGERTFPGRVMADRLAEAFADAGLGVRSDQTGSDEPASSWSTAPAGGGSGPIPR